MRIGRCIISTVHATSTFEPAPCGSQHEARLPLEVAVDEGFHAVRSLALGELDLNAHPVRQRWGDDTVEHGSGRQRVTLQTELLQPGPPTLELIDLFDGVPQIRRRNRELVVASVRMTGRRGMSRDDMAFDDSRDAPILDASRRMCSGGHRRHDTINVSSTRRACETATLPLAEGGAGSCSASALWVLSHVVSSSASLNTISSSVSIT